jgi:hypothetical protein
LNSLLLRLKWLRIIPFNSELEWNWQVNEQSSVMGNYAWQHATNKQANQPVKGVPEHHVYFAFQRVAWMELCEIRDFVALMPRILLHSIRATCYLL